MKHRKLTLKRETVTELGHDELGRVAGGASTPTCYSCPVQCVTPYLVGDPGPLPTEDCTSHYGSCPADIVSRAGLCHIG